MLDHNPGALVRATKQQGRDHVNSLNRQGDAQISRQKHRLCGNKAKKNKTPTKQNNEFELWLRAPVHVAAEMMPVFFCCCESREKPPPSAESSHGRGRGFLLVTPRPDNARSEAERRRCHAAA